MDPRIRRGRGAGSQSRSKDWAALFMLAAATAWVLLHIASGSQLLGRCVRRLLLCRQLQRHRPFPRPPPLQSWPGNISSRKPHQNRPQRRVGSLHLGGFFQHTSRFDSSAAFAAAAARAAAAASGGGRPLVKPALIRFGPLPSARGPTSISSPPLLPLPPPSFRRP